MTNPVIPKNKANPIGTGRIITSANKKLRSRFKQINRRMRELAFGLDYRIVASNKAEQKYKYEFLLDSSFGRTELQREINLMIDELVLDGGSLDWFMYQYSAMGFEQGTAESIANFETIAGPESAAPPDVPVYTRTLQQVLFSQPYLDRLAFVKGRMFEEFVGFSSQMKSDLGRSLANGMASGDSPTVIARDIKKRVGVNFSRAKRIARTEINMGHRNARFEEKKQAEALGIQTVLLHLSALSPTTRQTHADRHGHTYTTKEVQDWYQVDGNAVNCKCSQVETLAKNGEAIDQKFVKKLQAQGDKFFAA